MTKKIGCLRSFQSAVLNAFVRLSCATLIGASLMIGQVTPIPPSIDRAAFNTQAGVINPGAAPTMLSIVAYPAAAGGDQIEIVLGDPVAGLTLILPNGATVTAGTAASLGLTWTTQTFALSDLRDIINPFTIPGTHVSIQLPTGAAAGTYQIQALQRPFSTTYGTYSRCSGE
jgi:hypothetical protein